MEFVQIFAERRGGFLFCLLILELSSKNLEKPHKTSQKYEKEAGQGALVVKFA